MFESNCDSNELVEDVGIKMIPSVSFRHCFSSLKIFLHLKLSHFCGKKRDTQNVKSTRK